MTTSDLVLAGPAPSEPERGPPIFKQNPPRPHDPSRHGRSWPPPPTSRAGRHLAPPCCSAHPHSRQGHGDLHAHPSCWPCCRVTSGWVLPSAATWTPSGTPASPACAVSAAQPLGSSLRSSGPPRGPAIDAAALECLVRAHPDLPGHRCHGLAGPVPPAPQPQPAWRLSPGFVHQGGGSAQSRAFPPVLSTSF